MSETVPHENPLVNNKKLAADVCGYGRGTLSRRACCEVADEDDKTRHRLDSIRGQEACRVSTAIDLVPGDLVSDSQAGVVMDLFWEQMPVPC